MNAPISCPVLLKMTCTYCGKNGHKVNKCSLMLKDNQNYNCKKVYENKKECNEKMVVNRFDLLEVYDDDDKMDDEIKESNTETIAVTPTVKEKITGKRKGDWSIMVDSDSEDEE
jgi:hypothetical protein